MTSTSPQPYKFHPDTEYFLKKSCWYPKRDVSDKLCFPPDKNIFPAAHSIYKEFGYLDIDYNYTYKIPDIKNIFRHYGSLQMNIVPDTDALIFMNGRSKLLPMTEQQRKDHITSHALRDVSEIEKQTGKPCCHLGNLMDSDSAWEEYVFVDKDGVIYTTNDGKSFPHSKNFYEFIDTRISPKRFKEKLERA